MSNAERVVISPRMNSIDTIVLVGSFLFSVIIMGFAMWTKQVIAALAFGLIGLWSLGKICWQFLRFHRFAVVLEKDIVRIRPIYGAERVYPLAERRSPSEGSRGNLVVWCRGRRTISQCPHQLAKRRGTADA